jgi:flagellar M-ring protein FliF
LKRIVTPDPPAKLPPVPAPVPAPAMETEAQSQTPSIASPPLVPSENATMRMIEMAQIQGEVHAASIAKVGDLVEKNPHETVAIIRQWLSEGDNK